MELIESNQNVGAWGRWNLDVTAFSGCFTIFLCMSQIYLSSQLEHPLESTSCTQISQGHSFGTEMERSNYFTLVFGAIYFPCRNSVFWRAVWFVRVHDGRGYFSISGTCDIWLLKKKGWDWDTLVNLNGKQLNRNKRMLLRQKVFFKQWSFFPVRELCLCSCSIPSVKDSAFIFSFFFQSVAKIKDSSDCTGVFIEEITILKIEMLDDFFNRDNWSLSFCVWADLWYQPLANKIYHCLFFMVT